MSFKKMSYLIMCAFLLFFAVSIVTSFALIIGNNNSLNKVNQEIKVVLSLIDPINHSRTLRVRAMEYVKALDFGDTVAQSEKLSTVKEAMKKANEAFDAFMSSPRIQSENLLVDSYKNAWINYREQGLLPLLNAIEERVASSQCYLSKTKKMFDLDVSANCPFLLDLILVKSVNNVFLDLYSIGLQVDFIKV